MRWPRRQCRGALGGIRRRSGSCGLPLRETLPQQVQAFEDKIGTLRGCVVDAVEVTHGLEDTWHFAGVEEGVEQAKALGFIARRINVKAQGADSSCLGLAPRT